MRMSRLPFVVGLITFSVRSRNVTLCFLKQISWSTRIFLINDEVWWVIMGGFNKCRWSESKKRDIAWIKWCLYLKESFIFFLQNILFFFWFVVKYEHNFCWETHPTGPEVLAQLFQMFWHWSRVILETCTRLSQILSFFYYNILSVSFHFVIIIFVLSACWMLLYYLIIVYYYSLSDITHLLPRFAFGLFSLFISCHAVKLHFRNAV